MNNSGINKLGKRNTNRRLCAQYTKQIFEEPEELFFLNEHERGFRRGVY